MEMEESTGYQDGSSLNQPTLARSPIQRRQPFPASLDRDPMLPSVHLPGAREPDPVIPLLHCT